MKKVLFVLAVLAGVCGTATAQEASKTKKAALTRAQAVAEKKAVAEADEAKAFEKASETVVVAETDGKTDRQTQAVQAEKVRRAEAEKTKSIKN